MQHTSSFGSQMGKKAHRKKFLLHPIVWSLALFLHMLRQSCAILGFGVTHKTCSCRLGFSSIGHDDEGTLFFNLRTLEVEHDLETCQRP